MSDEKDEFTLMQERAVAAEKRVEELRKAYQKLDNEMHDALMIVQREKLAMYQALRNIMKLALKIDKYPAEEARANLLRFCREAGVEPSILREECSNPKCDPVPHYKDHPDCLDHKTGERQ